MKSRIQEFDLVAAGGGLFATLFLAAHLTDVHDEQFEFKTYLACGLFLAALGAWRLWLAPHLPGLNRFLLVALKMTGIAGGLELVAHRLTWVTALECGLISFCFWRQRRPLRESVEVGFVALVSFSCASSLLWWDRFPFFLAQTWWAAPIGGLVTALAAFAFFGPSSGEKSRVFLRTALLAPSVVVAGVGATWATAHFHDEGFWVGTIRLIRDGGHLLWDVPSQYGYLSLLFASHLPFASDWHAMWAACSLFLLLSLGLTYVLTLVALPSACGAALAALFVPPVVLLLPGWAPALGGVNGLPSVGPYRFLWVVSIVALFAADAAFLSRIKSRVLPGWIFWATAVAVWCTACFWSFETMVFSSLAFGAGAAGKWLGGGPGAGAWARTRAYILLPLLALLATFSLVEAGSWAAIGRRPDWGAFVEYARVYRAGFGSLPVDPHGAYVALALMIVLIFSLAVDLAARHPSARGVAFAAVAGAWAVCSYFVGRSHDNNILNLAPTLFGIAFALLALDRVLRRPGGLGSNALLQAQAALIAFLAVSCLSTLGQAQIGGWLKAAFTEHDRSDLDRTFPPLDEDVAALLKEMGYAHGDPISFFAPTLLRLYSFEGLDTTGAPSLLPLAPATQLGVLPMERQMRYVERYLEQAHFANPNGWLLYPSAFEAHPTVESFDGPEDRVLNPLAKVLPLLLTKHYLIVARGARGPWSAVHLVRPGPGRP